MAHLISSLAGSSPSSAIEVDARSSRGNQRLRFVRNGRKAGRSYPAARRAAGTPKEVVGLLHRAIANIVAPPEFNDRLLALGFDPVASAPDQFAAWIKIEIAKWGKVIREAGITLQ
jgi:hypothetical protein